MAGGNSHIQTGHIDSKFGISIHQIRHVIRVVKANNMDIAGLHMHTGSDIVDAEVFTLAAELLFEVAMNFDNLKYVDLGSGFKVSYRKDDVTTDIDRLGKVLGKRFEEFCEAYGKKLELWFEPGKFLVSEAGVFLVKVNVVKQTVSTVFAGVDSGQNHLIRPMMYEAYHHISNISNRGETQRVYSVVGYICETDTFGYDRKLTEVRAGDVLSIRNAGAYGFAMASNYNSRLRPAEVLILDGKAHLIRERETFEDLMKNQIEVI
jgi:diaminopimelate decarboxylase